MAKRAKTGITPSHATEVELSWHAANAQAGFFWGYHATAIGEALTVLLKSGDSIPALARDAARTLAGAFATAVGGDPAFAPLLVELECAAIPGETDDNDGAPQFIVKNGTIHHANDEAAETVTELMRALCAPSVTDVALSAAFSLVVITQSARAEKTGEPLTNRLLSTVLDKGLPGDELGHCSMFADAGGLRVLARALAAANMSRTDFPLSDLVAVLIVKTCMANRSSLVFDAFIFSLPPSAAHGAVSTLAHNSLLHLTRAAGEECKYDDLCALTEVMKAVLPTYDAMKAQNKTSSLVDATIVKLRDVVKPTVARLLKEHAQLSASTLHCLATLVDVLAETELAQALAVAVSAFATSCRADAAHNRQDVLSLKEALTNGVDVASRLLGSQAPLAVGAQALVAWRYSE